jgi:hypothetical protein
MLLYLGGDRRQNCSAAEAAHPDFGSTRVAWRTERQHRRRQDAFGGRCSKASLRRSAGPFPGSHYRADVAVAERPDQADTVIKIHPIALMDGRIRVPVSTTISLLGSPVDHDAKQKLVHERRVAAV